MEQAHTLLRHEGVGSICCQQARQSAQDGDGVGDEQPQPRDQQPKSIIPAPGLPL